MKVVLSLFFAALFCITRPILASTEHQEEILNQLEVTFETNERRLVSEGDDASLGNVQPPLLNELTFLPTYPLRKPWVNTLDQLIQNELGLEAHTYSPTRKHWVNTLDQFIQNELGLEAHTYSPTRKHWVNTLDQFIQNELGLEAHTYSVETFNYGYEGAKVRCNDGTSYEILLLDRYKGWEFLRSSLLFSKMHFEYLTIPTCHAVALYNQQYLIARTAPRGIPIASLYYEWRMSESNNFFAPEKLNALEEGILCALRALGKACADFQNASIEHSCIHPYLQKSTQRNLEEIEQNLASDSFLGFNYEQLEEVIQAAEESLKHTERPHAFSLSDTGLVDVSYDQQSDLITFRDSSECLDSIDIKKRAIFPAFFGYFQAVSSLIEDYFKGEMLAFFKAAFDEGYVAGGGKLPTEDEERIYRCMSGLTGLCYASSRNNLNYLYNQVREKHPKE